MVKAPLPVNPDEVFNGRDGDLGRAIEPAVERYLDENAPAVPDAPQPVDDAPSPDDAQSRGDAESRDPQAGPQTPAVTPVEQAQPAEAAGA